MLNLGLPRPVSILSIVRESIFRISASFSCESPSFVRASRTAVARFCFPSFIVIHLDSSLQYTSTVVNCIRIQKESESKYMIRRCKKLRNIKYEERLSIWTAIHIRVYHNGGKNLIVIHPFAIVYPLAFTALHYFRCSRQEAHLLLHKNQS